MMPIKQKLKSENGASFLLALLAFLVAAMVCVTIITAATSSVKRVHSDRDAQQMQLTLTSAAQLVRDTMGETQYCITTVTTTENGNATTETTKTAAGVFAQEIKDAIAYIDIHGGSAYADDMNLSVYADGMNLSVSGTALPVIAVSFVMTSDIAEPYKLLFTLRVQKTGEVLYLTMESSSTTERKTETIPSGSNRTKTVTTETTTITWDNPIISGIREES